MAKKNAREEPPKPTVAENAQMSDIVFILDKMELILKAVSEIGQDGKFKTVDADKRHRNSFLKIDRLRTSSRISSKISGASSRTRPVSASSPSGKEAWTLRKYSRP